MRGGSQCTAGAARPAPLAFRAAQRGCFETAAALTPGPQKEELGSAVGASVRSYVPEVVS